MAFFPRDAARVPPGSAPSAWCGSRALPQTCKSLKNYTKGQGSTHEMQCDADHGDTKRFSGNLDRKDQRSSDGLNPIISRELGVRPAGHSRRQKYVNEVAGFLVAG
jgi:hypothetical protein